jgi:DNA-binding beta-propeller fold protein YncE
MRRREFLAAGLAAPFALAGAPAALARAAARPLALVTADLESRVVAFDLATGRIVRDVETPPGPKSIETVGRGTAALVVHTTDGSITLLDIRTLRVSAALHGFAEPRYTAASTDGKHAFVTEAGSGDLLTIDLERALVVARTPVGLRARHLSLDASTGTLWTALGFSAPTLVVVDVRDPRRPRVTARIPPPFPAHDVVFAPGGTRLWVSSGNERRLAVYDRRSHRPLFTLPAGKPPQHIAFTRRAAYVTSDDAVRVHALADGRMLRETAVAEGSYNVTQGFARVFTPSLDHGTLSVLDERGRLLVQPTLAKAAHDACFALRKL